MIQIKAKVDQALSEIKKVTTEIENVKEASDESGKSLDKSMKSAAQSVAKVTGVIMAATAALIGFGKSTVETQKEIARLNAAFEASGKTVQEAGNSYKNIFGFLGDSQAAVEAAQQLALVSPDIEALREYEKILMGVYAQHGTSIETGGLAEGINHTIQLGEVQGTLADAFEFVGISVDAVNAKLATMNSQAEREAFIRSYLISLYGASANIYAANNASLIAYQQSEANLNLVMAQTGQILLPLMTAFNNLAATLLTSLRPALEVIVSAFVVVIQIVATAIKWIAAFFSIFSGGKSSSAVKSTNSISSGIASVGAGAKSAASGADGLNKSLGGAAKSAKELKKQVMGFDELNVVTDPAISGGAGGGGGGASVPDLDLGGMDLGDIGNFDLSGIDSFDDKLDAIKEKMEGLKALAVIVGAGLLAWKVVNLAKDMSGLIGLLQSVAGKVMIVAGAVLTVKGYMDAWATGVNWNNLAEMIVGVGLAVGGVALAFGTANAAFVAVIAGVALFVVALKDIIQNGTSLQNVMLLVTGVIIALIPIVAAFNVVLAANPIGLVIVAIAGLVAGIGVLIAAFSNEEKAIKTVEDAQNDLIEATNKAKEAHNTYINAVDGAESALKRLETAEKNCGQTGEELNKMVEDGTLDYADMTDVQREVYKAYLDSEEAQRKLKESTDALAEAKHNEAIASLENELALAKESGAYDDYKESVIEAFENGTLSAEEARDLIGKSMSEMSRDAQKTFMEDIPEDIKEGLDPKQYETTGQIMKKWFKQTWKDIKDTFSDVGTFFAGIGKSIADAVSKAFKSGLNSVITLIENKINQAIGLINGGINLINKIPGVSVKKVGKLSLPRLAEGGIVTDSIIANIGERGKEAVLPLENNIEWMDKLADRIAARNNTPTKVVLKIGEKELGWATIDAINGITKQTGGLQLEW